MRQYKCPTQRLQRALIVQCVTCSYQQGSTECKIGNQQYPGFARSQHHGAVGPRDSPEYHGNDEYRQYRSRGFELRVVEQMDQGALPQHHCVTHQQANAQYQISRLEHGGLLLLDACRCSQHG